jgi:hypothetical protein
MAKLADLIDLGLLAARPAAGMPGRLYQATDDTPPTVYRDNGVSWDVWATNASAADILDFATSEMTTSLVLRPDGAGGVHWVAPAVPVSGITTADMTTTHVLAPDGAGGVTTRAEAGGGGGGTPATNAAALIYAYLSFR